MDIQILAIGKMKAGAERALVDDYLSRANAVGRTVSLSPVTERALDPRDATQSGACAAILDALEPGDVVIALDERGASESSERLARRLEAWRDQARARVVLVIGGADGLTDEVRARADLLIAFGAQTWPHRLARVMAAEQVYRAASILSGAPYHRS